MRLPDGVRVVEVRVQPRLLVVVLQPTVALRLGRSCETSTRLSQCMVMVMCGACCADAAWCCPVLLLLLLLPLLCCCFNVSGFYEDFARVADDEARHFGWCVQRMAELGHRCGGGGAIQNMHACMHAWVPECLAATACKHTWIRRHVCWCWLCVEGPASPRETRRQSCEPPAPLCVCMCCVPGQGMATWWHMTCCGRAHRRPQATWQQGGWGGTGFRDHTVVVLLATDDPASGHVSNKTSCQVALCSTASLLFAERHHVVSALHLLRDYRCVCAPFAERLQLCLHSIC